MVSQLLSDQPIGPPLDPLLLQIPPRPMSIAESSNPTSTREDWEDDEDEEEPQLEHNKDMKRALIKSQSQDREESKVREGKKRKLKPKECVYQPDKRKRESYYRASSERLKESVRKIGVVTGCYGILYLSRHVLLSSLSTDNVGM